MHWFQSIFVFFYFSRRIHLPTLACRLFYENILKDLDEFSKTYSPYEHNLEIVFQLYHGVHRLAAIVEQIDFQIADGFKIEEWFYPFLKEWMALSDQKLIEWMRNAVSIDQVIILNTDNGVVESVGQWSIV